jgi:hypothetical protein
VEDLQHPDGKSKIVGNSRALRGAPPFAQLSNTSVSCVE